MTLELAAELRRLPAEIDAMPYLDSLSLFERLRKKREADAKFEAALHGKTLR